MRTRNDCLACAGKDAYELGDGCHHDIWMRLGLEPVACFDDPNASYSFNIFQIWKCKADGGLYYGTDCGCSCPSPFEDVRTLADLSAITPNSWGQFVRDFEAYGKQCGEPYSEDYSKKVGAQWVPLDERTRTLDKVRVLLYKNQGGDDKPLKRKHGGKRARKA